MLAVPPPYHLRPMVVADIPAVLAVDSLSFPSPANEQLFLNELTDNLLAHYQALVRDDAAGESLIGYAGFWLIAGEIHISTIAVLLLEARRMEPLLVTLEVRRSNTVAHALYRKYHFEEVGLRRRYYHDTGEDALLMTVDFATEPGYWAWLEEQAGQIAARSTAD